MPWVASGWVWDVVVAADEGDSDIGVGPGSDGLGQATSMEPGVQ